MFTKDFILKIIEKYFGSADAVMISGSQTNNEYIDKSKDVDLLIIKNLGIFGGYQSLKLEGITFDITIVPTINLDSLLIREINKESLSALLHGMSTGRILLDKFGQLKHYKDFANLLFKNKKDYTPHSYNDLIFSIQILEKLLSDYKLQKKKSLESYMILYQIVNKIIDLELIDHLGGTFPGNNKIKTRLFEIIDPNLSHSLYALLDGNKADKNKKALENHIYNIYIKKYQETLINNKAPSLKYNYFWNEKIAIKTKTKKKITEVLLLITSYIKQGKCNIYYQYAANPRENDAFHLLIIKGKYSFLLKVIVPILDNLRASDLFLKAANFPLLERYNGGQEILLASELFYSYLSESILSFGGRKRCKKLSEIERNSLAIIIIQIYCRFFQLDFTLFMAFLSYMFDHWFPYSYSRREQSFEENHTFKKNTLKEFNVLYNTQKEQLEYLFTEINLYSHNGESKHKYLNSLYKELQALYEKTKSCKRYVPQFDVKMIKNYADSDQVDLWYIYRKQFEAILVILDIENVNWSYLIYITKRNVENNLI